MAKTWKDLKDETLQLMFSYSGGGPAPGSEDTVAAMPAAANYALRDLASVCRPIVRRYGLSHHPVPNMLGDGAAGSRPTARFEIVQVRGEEVAFAAVDPKAYYFEVDAPCLVVLEQLQGNGAFLQFRSIEHAGPGALPGLGALPGPGSFTAYRGLIDLNGTIRLRFTAGTLYNVRNVAFYKDSFARAGDVPPFTRYDRYNIRELTKTESGAVTFMRLSPNNVVAMSGSEYGRSDNFYWEGDCTIVIDHYASAQYDILYEAYPTEITAGTPDTFVPELPPEALDIVPLYMAGRLYMEDDAGKATSYLNQYSARRSELSVDTPPLGTTGWANETGWW